MMMKPILALCLILFFNTIYSQNGFTWQNPNPTTNLLYDVEFISENIGWITGLQGTIIKTTDGGNTWHHQYSAIEDIRKIRFHDENIGIAVGSNGTILKTTNGGNKWEKLIANTTEDLSGVDLINENTYVVVGGSVILKSSDGGRTWIKKFNYSRLFEVLFYNEKLGIATSYSGTIKTTDGGETWKANFLGKYSESRKISFIDENNIFMVGDSLMHSTDGGETWILQSLDSLYGYADIFFKDRNNGVIFNNDVIYKTTNGGLDWALYPIGYYSLKGLEYLNDSTFIAAGGVGIIVKTTDTGITWELKTKGFFDNITKINFVNENIGYVSCATGNIFKTTNAGTDWLKLNTENTQALRDITFFDEENVIASGDNIILTTSDGGISWSRIPIPFYDIFAVQYIDKYNIVCVSVNSIIKSTDKGKTWDVHFVPNNEIIGVHFKDANNGIIFGAKDIIKTSDGGMNWQSIQLITGEKIIYNEVQFKNETGFLKISNNNYLKTIDGGENWEVVRFPMSGKLGIVNESTFSIYNGISSYTTINNGITWYITNTIYYNVYLYYNGIKDFKVVSPQQGYLAGDFGKIIKFNPMYIPTIVESPSSIYPSEFSLTQNYPNPFNPTTTINYTIAKGGRSSMIIYDVLGREVKRIFDEEKAAGNYTIQFNGSGLSSGIYFYKLQNEDYSESKKMVLIK